MSNGDSGDLVGWQVCLKCLPDVGMKLLRLLRPGFELDECLRGFDFGHIVLEMRSFTCTICGWRFEAPVVMGVVLDVDEIIIIDCMTIAEEF